MILWLASCVVARSDLFTNLGFEDFQDPNPPKNWTVTPDYWLGMNTIPISGAGVGLVNSNNIASLPVIQGSNSLYLSAGFAPDLSLPEVGIWQTAMVPGAATHIEFITHYVNTNNVIYTYSLGSIDLLASSPETLSGGLLKYTADVQSLAGTTQTLTFAVQARSGGADGHVLDDIQFVIPEPQIFALITIGALLLGYFRIVTKR